MKTNYIKQIVYDMRHHPMVTWVNILGTAMAIFLLMVVVQIDSIKVESFRPESNRDRMLHSISLGIKEKYGDGESSNMGPMSYKTIQRLYDGLPGSEAVTVYEYGTTTKAVSLPSQKPFSVKSKEVDDRFFVVFDLKFIDGKPFDKTKVDGSAVITETVAQRLFGSTDVAGKTILLDYSPYTVAGVVEDVSSFATMAYAEIWISLNNSMYDTWHHVLGSYYSTVLAESRDKFPEIRRESKRRTMALLNELKESTSIFEINDSYQLMDQESLSVGPKLQFDYDEVSRKRWILYAILLIVPAINISSMTNSRMRQRFSEMAVMRSYGCTRWRLMWSLIVENLIVTLCAGVIGLAASLVFAWLAPEFLFVSGSSVSYSNPTINLSILFHWSTFFMAMAFCFVLNLMSVGIPAWITSRLNIINALRGSK